MSLGPIVDVALGLVFVYLLLSLITTSFQEMVAGWMRLRGKALRDAIAGLLSKEEGKDSNLFAMVYSHPFVGGAVAKNLPSYVASKNFAVAVIDSLSDGSNAPIFTQVEREIANVPAGPVRDALTSMVRHAAGDLDKFKEHLAVWYDDAMDRLSGSFKRHVRNLMLVYAAILTIGLNVDSFQVGLALWSNDALRTSVTAAAEVQAKSPVAQETDASKAFQANLNRLTDLQLPIGWLSPDQTNPQEAAIEASLRKLSDKCWFGYTGCVIGWHLHLGGALCSLARHHRSHLGLAGDDRGNFDGVAVLVPYASACCGTQSDWP